MSLPSIYLPANTQVLLDRIDCLSPLSTPLWGKMSVSQMLAHCAITYKEILSEKPPKKAPWIMRLAAGLFFKRSLTGDKPMARNLPTGKALVITDEPEFMRVRDNLKDVIQRAHGLGEQHFEGLESGLFGKLSAQQWSNMLYKHLDHHLRQFGV